MPNMDLRVGDSVELAKTLSDESIDCTVVIGCYP